MKRRSFLKNTTLASSLMLVPGFIRAFDDVLLNSDGYNRLVVVHLSGGNDILNTLVPFRNDIYYSLRPKLALSGNDILKLNDEIGLHKSLLPFQRLYDKGYVSILNNVGYPNPNRSHFRSTDIWQSASGSDQYLKSGWIGRYLDHLNAEPHYAIEVNSTLSLALKGETVNGIATNNPKLLYRTAKDPYIRKFMAYNQDDHLSEHNLGYLYKTLIKAQSSASYIYEKTRTKSSAAGYTQHSFGKQLKTTAEFINSGLKTKVYYTLHNGYDTHANQKNTQTRLLNVFAKNLETFVKDLEDNDTFKDTLILVFSEFGRRVEQNAGNGTDHGAANSVFIIGKHLKKAGFYNQMSDLTDLDENGDIRYEIDFRSVYATILNNWLNTSSQAIVYSEDPLLTFI